MNCIKRLGERVMSKTFERQVNGLHIRSAILNRFTELGRPRTVAVSGVRGQGCSADRQTQPRPYLPMGDGLEAAQWLARNRRGFLASKNGRILWALTTQERTYEAAHIAERPRPPVFAVA